jgi:glyoxylate/hydroxypyruvate/2-ketogluconate reductase
MLTPPFVLVAGPPESAPFMTKVAEALQGDSHAVELLVDGTHPVDHPRWDEVRLLVIFALPCDGEAMARASSLEGIVVPSLGFDGVDIEAATRNGILVANGAVPENVESVAEATIGLIVTALYDIRSAERRLRDNVARSGPPGARMLRGKRIGFIGFGKIASAIALRLSTWGIDMVAHSRRPIEAANLAVADITLDELLRTSDVIVPLVPLTDQTRHLLGRAELSIAKQNAVLVNVSRGAVIDERALADPSIAARFHTIALDVFETEPLGPDSPLRALPNAILTGHEISHTAENLGALFQRTISNVQDALAGRLPATALNPEALGRRPAASKQT